MELITNADVAELIGMLLGAYGLGWGAGYIQVTFIKASEKI